VTIQVLPLEENQTAWPSSLAAHPQINSVTASTTTTTATPAST
jgi:hypothetical protein